MFVYLYKAVVSFIMPPGIILVALVVLNGLMYRQRQKYAKALSVIIALLYCLSTPLVATSLLHSLEYCYTPGDYAVGDVIVVLGGGATLDTPDLDGTGNLSGIAANRLLTGARLYQKLRTPIIISGGQVFKTSGTESVIAKRQLIGLGIPADKLIVEDNSINTQQNAENTGKILREKGFTHPILVTSAFHMERSVLQFGKQNIAVIPFPADYVTSVHGGWNAYSLIPSAGALYGSYTVLHEYLGIAAATLW